MNNASRNMILIAGSLIVVMVMGVLVALHKAIPYPSGDGAAAGVTQSADSSNASDDLWTRVADLKESSKSQQERIANLEKAIKANVAAIDRLDAELETAQQSPGQNARQIRTISTEIDRLKSENAKLKDELAALNLQHESEADSYQREIDTLNNSNQLISDEIKRLKEKNAPEDTTK